MPFSCALGICDSLHIQSEKEKWTRNEINEAIFICLTRESTKEVNKGALLNIAKYLYFERRQKEH